MSDTEKHPSPALDQPDLVGNAIERTDNGFDGKKDGERVIGRDVPAEEQDAEEDEEPS